MGSINMCENTEVYGVILLVVLMIVYVITAALRMRKSFKIINDNIINKEPRLKKLAQLQVEKEILVEALKRAPCVLVPMLPAGVQPQRPHVETCYRCSVLNAVDAWGDKS